MLELLLFNTRTDPISFLLAILKTPRPQANESQIVTYETRKQSDLVGFVLYSSLHLPLCVPLLPEEVYLPTVVRRSSETNGRYRSPDVVGKSQRS